MVWEAEEVPQEWKEFLQATSEGHCDPALPDLQQSPACLPVLAEPQACSLLLRTPHMQSEPPLTWLKRWESTVSGKVLVKPESCRRDRKPE